MLNFLRETVAGKTIDQLRTDGVLRVKRTQRRMDLLAAKLHTVGAVNLPLPNVVAMREIARLDASDILAFTMDAVWILHVQCDEDALFLRGSERERAIIRFWTKRPAAGISEYYIALMETLRALEKKSSSFWTAMLKQTQELMTSMTPPNSSSSPKPTDNPSATSSSN